jgi:hypothetical protein
MRLRPAPTVATRLLNLFCSGPKHESAIGDLIEKYQQGRGRFWYWRQVLGIVVFGCYRSAGTQFFEATKKIPMREAGALLLSLAAFSTLLLSPIWPMFLIAILAGGAIAIFLFGFAKGPMVPDVREPGVARIDSSKITVGGGAGAGLLIVILLTSVLYELPLLRLWAAPGLLLGLVFAAALRFWGKLHPRDISKHWISIRPK